MCRVAITYAVALLSMQACEVQTLHTVYGHTSNTTVTYNIVGGNKQAGCFWRQTQEWLPLDLHYGTSNVFCGKKMKERRFILPSD